MTKLNFSFFLLMGLAAGQACFAQGNTLQASQSSVGLHPDTVFSRRADDLIKEPDVVKKEQIYQELMKNYPADGNEYRAKRFYYSRMNLAMFWSSKGNKDKALEYYRQIKHDLNTGMAVAIASNFLRHKYYQEVITLLDDWMENITKSAADKTNLYTFHQAYDAYSLALFHLDKKKEALNYITKAYQNSDQKNTQINSTYSLVLNSLDMHAQALPIMESLVRDGMATAEIKKIYKDSYLKNKGNVQDFNRLMANLEKGLQEKMKHEADKKLVDEPAFAFSLRNMDGKMVSLSDMKGKVVVLDFWATWCGPCIKSMPAMQTAANHYKKDPNVEFLFIDTGEKIEDYESAVKKLLAENNYDFHVLYDVRDPETKKCPVATGYAIKGIPTKLVIDGKGRVRYRIVGYNGGSDATVAELTAMIEKAKSL